jgi:hypothetical protein
MKLEKTITTTTTPRMVKKVKGTPEAVVTQEAMATGKMPSAASAAQYSNPVHAHLLIVGCTSSE